MDKKTYSSFRKILVYLLIYIAIGYVIIHFGFNKRYLIFNAGLSFIPYILTSFCANNKDRILLCTILTLIAIIFYPNAIYMFTDFTHIKTKEYYEFVNGVVTYNMDYLVWIKLSCEVSLITLSLVLSFESFLNILKIVNCYNHLVASFIVLLFFSAITGIALYLGRFLRLNSWDIYKIKEIFIHLLHNLTTNDYILIGVFAAIHFVIILIFANLKNN
ncbi:DUF1361 domain-containing protein [Peptoniphilus stercorisuis]|uniref:Membrane protein n=1 Tax=Peptoniphilus stercorisuis TaxID=1436965 RepID=A0ABS4K9U5_9FIRM|nr:DUF1361 domain-containing protein [Peptoniphilus stercorisuis]MBP2024518.1 putative membrane protein [Peptoniphilus stercorisuis]